MTGGAIAGSLPELADILTRIAPGKLAIIAGDEISASDASAETVALAEAFGAPVFGVLMAGPYPLSDRASALAGQSSHEGERDPRETRALRRHLRARRKIRDHDPLFRGPCRTALLPGVPALERRPRPRAHLFDGALDGRRHKGVPEGPVAHAGPEAGAPARRHRQTAGNRGARARRPPRGSEGEGGG